MKFTENQILKHLKSRGGYLRHGRHINCQDACGCLIEEMNLFAGVCAPYHTVDFNDRWPDLRGFNDSWPSGVYGDIARTEACVPLAAIISDWAEWTTRKQRAFVTILFAAALHIGIANVPGMPQEVRIPCSSTNLTAVQVLGYIGAALYADTQIHIVAGYARRFMDEFVDGKYRLAIPHALTIAVECEKLGSPNARQATIDTLVQRWAIHLELRHDQ